MSRVRITVVVAVAAWVLAGWTLIGARAQAPAGKSAAPTASAELKNQKGEPVGKAELTDTPDGVLVHLTVSGLPPGVHAFHIHEAGKCDPPDFKTAGGHFNPGMKQHGFMQEKGPHAGDLPNIHVPASGNLEIEALARGVALQAGPNSLFDADGSALVIHAGPDDYRTDPAGNAGARLACGIVSK